jgi:transcription antitermination factor NusG
MIADCHLTALRTIEAKRAPKKRALYSFPRNASVRVDGGIFGGMTGVVVRSTPAVTVLRFSGRFPVEIPTTMLELKGEMEMAA